mgnify:CR=1 FL=1
MCWRGATVNRSQHKRLPAYRSKYNRDPETVAGRFQFPSVTTITPFIPA